MSADFSDTLLLDLRGLKCPLPAMRTRTRLRELPSGAILDVLTTDPMSVIDVPHAAVQAGGRVISQGVFESGHRFRIERVG